MFEDTKQIYHFTLSYSRPGSHPLSCHSRFLHHCRLVFNVSLCPHNEIGLTAVPRIIAVIFGREHVSMSHMTLCQQVVRPPVRLDGLTTPLKLHWTKNDATDPDACSMFATPTRDTVCIFLCVYVCCYSAMIINLPKKIRNQFVHRLVFAYCECHVSHIIRKTSNSKYFQ